MDAAQNLCLHSKLEQICFNVLLNLFTKGILTM